MGDNSDLLFSAASHMPSPHLRVHPRNEQCFRVLSSRCWCAAQNSFLHDSAPVLGTRTSSHTLSSFKAVRHVPKYFFTPISEKLMCPIFFSSFFRGLMKQFSNGLFSAKSLVNDAFAQFPWWYFDSKRKLNDVSFVSLSETYSLLKLHLRRNCIRVDSSRSWRKIGCWTWYRSSSAEASFFR